MDEGTAFPCAVITQTIVANLSAASQIGHRLNDLFHGGGGIGMMKIIQVDVVSAQCTQADVNVVHRIVRYPQELIQKKRH